MKRTRICDLLGIEHPIIQGGMTWIANAELAAAVSEAGALGIISPNAAMRLEGDVVENLRSQIRKAKSLTDKPFGVNLPVQIPECKELIDVVIEEGVKVVTTSAGNPALHTPRLKEGGVKVLHVVASVRHAKGAERHGVDAVIAEGYEAGGHNGFDELPTFVLVPQVVEAVSIPVVAAGGIADARGFVAALALGAEGVQMGTRFVATHECVAHQNFKEMIVKATDTGTMITGRKLGPTRGIKNEFTAKLLEMDKRGASAEEILAFIGVGRSRMGQLEGKVQEGEVYCGAIAGVISEIVSAGEVVRSIVDSYSRVVANL
ncbi:MAG: nitronate monooxygenase [Dehalococcoidia bacterium]|nr:nitronate monooxygenase [Dehalococcoidia bacterium]